MNPGDVVQHRASGRLMTVEAVDGELIACVWFLGDELHRREFRVGFLKTLKEASA